MFINHVRLLKERFDKIPETAKLTLLLLCHATNELNALARLIVLASNSNDSSNAAQKSYKFTNIFMLMCILAGKLYETWLVVQRNFLRSKDLAQYIPDLNTRASESLNFLKKYFHCSDNHIQ
jgi:hypothetical protein